MIGDKANVSETKAMQYIAGYTIVNDVSERAYQLDAAAGNGQGEKVVTLSVLLAPI